MWNTLMKLSSHGLLLHYIDKNELCFKDDQDGKIEQRKVFFFVTFSVLAELTF